MLEKIKINKKLIRQLDFSILIITIIIVLFGALNIRSASQILFKNGQLLSSNQLFNTQLKWLIIGLVFMYLILMFDYSAIQGYAGLIYWFGVFLLILNDFVFPSKVNGAESWMKIGPLPAFQPSEFAKIGMIIMIAKKLNDMEGEINNLKNFLVLCMYALIPMALIVIQPDMGMTMVCFFIVLGMFFIAGLDNRIIIGGLTSLVVLISVVWNSGLIRPHQKARWMTFLNPDADKAGIGLQLYQSLISIGSGGIVGTGFEKGTQTAGGFVPEHQTDFIFSVVGEEWGLIGATILVLSYAILIYRFIKISKNSKDIFGSAMTAGIISLFLFSVLQNIGMTIGIMPITGITLPLMSYGGSSLLTTSISIGLILNVGMRRKKINF